VPIQIARGKVFRAMEAKELAGKVRRGSPNALRAFRSRHDPTQEIEGQFLTLFHLPTPRCAFSYHTQRLVATPLPGWNLCNSSGCTS
jgi:hypothetical protein